MTKYIKTNLKPPTSPLSPIPTQSPTLFLMPLRLLLLKLLNKLLLHKLHNRRMSLILHTKLPLPLRTTPQIRRKPKHLIQRYLRRDFHIIVANLRVSNRSFAFVEETDHGGLVF